MTDHDHDAVAEPAAAGDLFDRRDRDWVRDHASFVASSIRRHRLLVALVFAAIVSATVGSLFVLPKSYHVEAKALAQPDSALTVRGDGPGADSLTRVAAETVLRHENLLALIVQTDLLQHTRAHRAPAQIARDWVLAALHAHEESDAERLEALVTVLEKKLVVWTNDSGNAVGGSTVTIAIDWQDAPMACLVVDAAQRAFLDARYAREVTALAESIEILQRHTATLQQDIDAAVGGIAKMRAPDGESAAPAAVAPPARMQQLATRAPAPVPPASGPDPELQRLQNQLDAKNRAIQELEGLRRQQLSELQARLAEARTTYTESHPTITNLKQSLAALSAESPQLSALRQEAASLKAQCESRTATASAPPATALVWTTTPWAQPAGGAAPPQVPNDVLRLSLDLREDRDPDMVYARGQLRDAMDKYAALRTQIQTAQIDLETAQAAFKYRYTVVTPARLPRAPTTPNVPVVILAGLLVGLFLGVVLAVGVDVRRGRLLEPWQVERLLGRPVLGEVSLLDGEASGDAK